MSLTSATRRQFRCRGTSSPARWVIRLRSSPSSSPSPADGPLAGGRARLVRRVSGRLGAVLRGPLSVEPMKAFAALVIAGTVSTGEGVLAGLLLAWRPARREPLHARVATVRRRYRCPRGATRRRAGPARNRHRSWAQRPKTRDCRRWHCCRPRASGPQRAERLRRRPWSRHRPRGDRGPDARPSQRSTPCLCFRQCLSLPSWEAASPSWR